ncbi:LysR family transcriptional regulator [Microbacterium imperiale]|uniref:LysR family transcriptional regulator n=1 Tax=Microbacterium imperiale TaxID=33884 RepID=A0A9W6M267_9MICO|nr:LysR family transcriptional regulator [Microbacterium imperiale]MBP2419977.1 DNA-binding transcriptional LysR family regulator [Microbacterium imperiale]BFE40319.1 LysR family transcriptional regulator [Microbacterium imperiale]GLJ78705.1 LysR family transcriptional regulator [Microbacterium imperiale]
MDHLRTFVTVYRAGSVTHAARLLGISQATASTHVQALERSLGYALFHRDRDGVRPTGRGIELAREVAGHVDAIEDAALLSGPADSSTRAIRVGGAAEMLSVMVIPHLSELIDAVAAPMLLEFGLAEDLLDRLADRSLDIVVSAVAPRRRGISAVPIYDEEFLLVAAPSWLGADPETVPVIAYADNLPIVRRYWRSVFNRPPEGLRLVAVIPDLRGIRTLVLTGAGMSVLPAYLVADDLDAGSLITLDAPTVLPLNTVFLATRGREMESNAALGAIASHLRRLIH